MLMREVDQPSPTVHEFLSPIALYLHLFPIKNEDAVHEDEINDGVKIITEKFKTSACYTGHSNTGPVA